MYHSTDMKNGRIYNLEKLVQNVTMKDLKYLAPIIVYSYVYLGDEKLFRDASIKMIKMNPNDGHTWALYGIGLFYFGHYDEAIKKCLTAKHLGAPKDDDIDFHLSYIYYHIENSYTLFTQYFSGVI